MRPTGSRLGRGSRPEGNRRASGAGDGGGQGRGAEARIVLDWNAPLRYATFYKAVFPPAILQSSRLGAATGERQFSRRGWSSKYSDTRYALLFIAGATDVWVSPFMGHSKPSTTESVYAHLLDDDNSGAMTALRMLAVGSNPEAANVIRLRR